MSASPSCYPPAPGCASTAITIDDDISLLGEELKLIGNGRLCLGRPLEDDPAGHYTVRFELVKA